MNNFKKSDLIKQYHVVLIFTIIGSHYEQVIVLICLDTYYNIYIISIRETGGDLGTLIIIYIISIRETGGDLGQGRLPYNNNESPLTFIILYYCCWFS